MDFLGVSLFTNTSLVIVMIFLRLKFLGNRMFKAEKYGN